MVYPCLCLRYAPALRQLRQVAFLVTFPPTIPARLAARLLEVMFVCVFSKRVGEVSLVLYPASFYISFMSWASSYFINGLNGGCWCPLVCWHPSLLLTCKKDTCDVLSSDLILDISWYFLPLTRSWRKLYPFFSDIKARVN